MRRKRESRFEKIQFKMPKFFFFTRFFIIIISTGRYFVNTKARAKRERKKQRERRRTTSGGTFSCKLCVYIYKYGSALLRERALSCLSLSVSLFPSSLASRFELSLLYSSSSSLFFLTARSFRGRLVEERKGSPIFPQPRKGALKCRLRCL